MHLNGACVGHVAPPRADDEETGDDDLCERALVPFAMWLLAPRQLWRTGADQLYGRAGESARSGLAQSAKLSADTRELARAGIRARHPDYRDEEVESALRRLLLGDELFHRVWPALPLLSP